MKKLYTEESEWLTPKKTTIENILKYSKSFHLIQLNRLKYSTSMN